MTTAFEIVNLIKPEIRKASRLFRSKSPDRNGLVSHAQLTANQGHAQLIANQGHAQLTANQAISSEDYLNEFFSLYIVSPHLELQLLPAHEPFKLLACWNSILSKYTSIKREGILVDEPILSYQRNIFLKRHEESIVEDAFILELLYEEAKVNILSGRYPYHDYESLASIQAAIDLGPFQSRVHCPSYFKVKDYIYLPLHYRQMIKKSSNQGVIRKSFGRLLGSPTTPGGGKVHPPPSASRLFHNNTQRSQSSSNQDANSGYSARAQSSSPYVRITEMFKSIYEDAHPSKIELIRSYLSRCWTLPFYGSAFFIGRIETLCESKIKRIVSPCLDRTIYVAVNWEGIHLIDKNNSLRLMSLAYDEFKWQLGHPHHTNLDCSTRSDPHLVQCLFIQITIKERGNESRGKECKIFQIFSKSSPLIASLIKHFSSHAQLTDVPDSGSFREDLVTNTKPIDKSMIGPLERICCATFNAKGECIKFQGSISVLT